MESPFFNPNSFQGIPALKKRKRQQFISNASSSEDQDVEESKSNNDIQYKRQIHSKIEKRRRDKMNSYITQLSTMIPTYNSTAQKMDKITVLRMALQYLKSIQRSPMQLSLEENLKYSFVTDVELKKLVLQMSRGFVFVISCDSARILFVSQSVSKILNCNYTNLLGRSLYDVIHPHDVDKVKEQISRADLNHKHQLTDSKSNCDMEIEIPSEQLGLNPGHRCSFFFRIKSNIEEATNYNLDGNKYSSQNYKNISEFPFTHKTPLDQNQYTTIQCVGYLKRWNSAINKVKILDNTEDVTSLTCLTAVGQRLDDLTETFDFEKPCTFVSKHAIDGKFIFVDHWFTLRTGYLPQEMLGTSIYDFIHSDDINEFAATHMLMLQCPNDLLITREFRFRLKSGTYLNIRSEWRSLLNPWTKEIEYFYSKNRVTWPKDIMMNYDKIEIESTLPQPDLFEFSNFPFEKPDPSIIMDFDFQNTDCGKINHEDSMEAILKILECDANITN